MEQSNKSETEQHIIDKTCEMHENKATEWTRTAIHQSTDCVKIQSINSTTVGF